MAYRVVDINTNEEVGFFTSYDRAVRWALACEKDGCNVEIIDDETDEEIMPWEIE